MQEDLRGSTGICCEQIRRDRNNMAVGVNSDPKAPVWRLRNSQGAMLALEAGTG